MLQFTQNKTQRSVQLISFCLTQTFVNFIFLHSVHYQHPLRSTNQQIIFPYTRICILQYHTVKWFCFEIKWSEVKWSEVKWSEVKWSEVKWSEVKWSGVEWSEVKWSEVKWIGVEWSGVKWSEVKWSEVKWSEVKWSEVKWSEVRWSEVEWSEVKWSGVTVKFLGTQVPCTLGRPYTEDNCLYCKYFIWWISFTEVVWTCFVMCGCVYVVGVLTIVWIFW